VIAFLLSPLGLRILSVVGILIALAGLYATIWERGNKHGQQVVQKQFDAYKAEATKRATDLANMWDAKRQEAEKAQQEAERARQQALESAVKAAKALPPSVANVRIDSSVASLLDRASGNGEAAGSTAESRKEAAAPPADTTVGPLTERGVAVIRLYESCRQQVSGLQSFYQSLQEAK